MKEIISPLNFFTIQQFLKIRKKLIQDTPIHNLHRYSFIEQFFSNNNNNNNNNNGRRKRDSVAVAIDSEALEDCARRNVVETFSFLHFLYDSSDEFCYQESLVKFNQLLNDSSNCEGMLFWVSNISSFNDEETDYTLCRKFTGLLLWLPLTECWIKCSIASKRIVGKRLCDTFLLGSAYVTLLWQHLMKPREKTFM